MSAGLGRQYAFIGPIEALYLDCEGKFVSTCLIPVSCLLCHMEYVFTQMKAQE